MSCGLNISDGRGDLPALADGLGYTQVPPEATALFRSGGLAAPWRAAAITSAGATFRRWWPELHVVGRRMGTAVVWDH